MGRRKKSDMMVAESNGEETRIGFLLDIIPERKRGWTLDKAKAAVRLIQNGRKAKDIAKVVALSEFGVSQFLKELRRAAEKGYTLEAYFKAGRPLHAAKQKVL